MTPLPSPPKVKHEIPFDRWTDLLYIYLRALVTGVSSVSNSDSTLTISPTTGAVVASLNLGQANTWTARQLIQLATEQLRLGYDVSNYVNFTVGSTGVLTIDFTGTGSSIVINEASGDVDIRIEGNGDANLFYLDAGNDRIGIGTASPGSKLDVAGSLQCDSITNDTGLAAGTYTPTRSAETNLDSNVTTTEAQYMRVGNTVTVSGNFTADPTLTATLTSFEITLPISSNLGAAEDVSGVAFCGSVAGQGAAVFGVVANDTAKVEWISGDVNSRSWHYIFQYQVI